MNMFAVGDMVKIVGYPKYASGMKKLLGKTLEIQDIHKDRNIHGGAWYVVEGWSWKECWLEPVNTRDRIEELL